jgi:hypothetical protein
LLHVCKLKNNFIVIWVSCFSFFESIASATLLRAIPHHTW